MLIRERGVITAREAAGRLGVNQSTIARALSHLGSRRVLRIGNARAARYGWRRNVRGQGDRWPLYRVDDDARVHLMGQLHALSHGQWVLAQEEAWESLRGREFRDGLYPGLPWFLHDSRPLGFLGRCFVRRHAVDLGTPADPRLWSDDDCLLGFLRFGDDLPGAFVVGEAMLAVAQTRMSQHPPAGASRQGDFPRLAEAVLAGDMPGSSAAGEQPKFTTCAEDETGRCHHAIVKFSGAAGRPEDVRWADLLVAEHVANRVLAGQDIPCAATGILSAGGRVFLESRRFDRIGPYGRRGLVSLEALDSAFYGELGTPWTAAAARMLADGWLTEEDAERLATLWWFGSLIGNTDMHYGNVSLLLEPARPFHLAPTYDMVPMHYRPNAEGQVSHEPLVCAPPAPETMPVWTRAAELATAFWSRLSDDRAVSDAFRGTAGQNAEAVSSLHRRFR